MSNIDILVEKYTNEGIKDWAQEHTMDLLSLGICAAMAAVWDYVLFSGVEFDPKTVSGLMEGTLALMTVVWLPYVVMDAMDVYAFVKDIAQRFWRFITRAEQREKEANEKELQDLTARIKTKLETRLKNAKNASTIKAVESRLKTIEAAINSKNQTNIRRAFHDAEDYIKKAKQVPVTEGAFARMYDEIEDFIHRHKKKKSKKELENWAWKTFKNKDSRMTPQQFSETFEEIWVRV